MAVSLAQGLSRRPEGVDAITDQEVQHEIERVLREQLLFGSERELPIDSPLGELGLDSLALLHLILAVEEMFGVHLPDDLLVRRDPLSMRDLIDMVVATPRTRPGSSVVAPSDSKRLPPHLRMERLHRWLAARGWLGERVRTVATLAWHAKRFLFERSEHYVMERRLDEGGEPTIGPPPGVDLRSYTSADQDLMAGLWPDFEERGSRRELAAPPSPGSRACGHPTGRSRRRCRPGPGCTPARTAAGRPWWTCRARRCRRGSGPS